MATGTRREQKQQLEGLDARSRCEPIGTLLSAPPLRACPTHPFAGWCAALRALQITMFDVQQRVSIAELSAPFVK